ncbi:MAG: hypothetical protein A4E35_01771 [Methanoregula sp. PtaU1.Bin051]|nr:MAG: hypothetical protein A4E35_01771 [Methanoregula sp. PtaU1.Bin051]
MAEKTLLQQIREKELMLNIKIEDTRKEAEEIIIAAKKQAMKMIENSEKEGRNSAEDYYKKEIEKTNLEIEKLRNQSNLQALDIKQEGERNLKAAIEKIVKSVLME